MPPLVTCIMPTAARREHLRRAIGLFMAQDYEHKRLVVVEDGEQFNGDLAFGNSLVEYHHLGKVRRTIGKKRNLACEYAAMDSLIAHFDDDDWHNPRRLSAQVAAMQGGARLCGLGELVYLDERASEAYLYQAAPHPLGYPWLAGGTLVYEHSLWREQPFEDVSSGEDVRFIRRAFERGVRPVTLDTPSLYVALLHGGNTETRSRDPQWGGFDADTVYQWIGGKAP